MAIDLELPTPPYKDRKTGLIVFGIFQVLLGVLAICLLLFMVAAQLTIGRRPATAPAPSLLPSILIFLTFGVSLVWLGIGSMMARRWARALTVCLSSLALVSGAIVSVALFWIVPGMDAAMRAGAAQSGQPMPASALVIAKVAIVGMALLFYVIIPAGLLLFYRSRHVKLTCEALDPVPRWTDRCPPPVLAVVLVQIIGAASMLMTLASYGSAFPLFGFLLHGIAAKAVYIGFALVSLWLARGFYRLERWALWSYMTFVGLVGLNSIITFTGKRLWTFYEASGMPAAQVQQMQTMPFVSAFVWLGSAGALAIVGYLVWLRRYFQPETAIEQGVES
jgi:hypothetical protein